MVASPVVTPAFLIRLESRATRSYRRGLRTAVGNAIAHGERRILVDCAACRHLHLVVLSALVACAEDCTASNTLFELSNVSDDVRRQIESLMLGERLGMTASIEAAN